MSGSALRARGRTGPSEGRPDVARRTHPHHRPLQRDRHPQRRHGQREGPPGHPRAHAARGHHGRPGGRHARGQPARRRAPAPRPARPVALAGGQHGLGRHRGVHQGARDRRRGLPRHGQGPRRAGAGPRLLPPGAWSTPPRASPSRCPVPTRIIVKGIDKEKVGQVAADIRKLRKPEPYKGKGCATPTNECCARPERRRSRWHARATAPGCACGATTGCGPRCTAPPSGRGWPSTGPTGTSRPSSSTTPAATPWLRPRRSSRTCVRRWAGPAAVTCRAPNRSVASLGSQGQDGRDHQGGLRPWGLRVSRACRRPGRRGTGRGTGVLSMVDTQYEERTI